MDAEYMQRIAANRSVLTQDFQRLLRPALLAAAACLLLAAGVLAVRRVDGGLIEPLPTPGLLFTGIAAAVLGWGLRLAWGHISHVASPRWQTAAINWAPTLALVSIGAAVSLPGSSPGALVAFWALLLGSEAASRIRWRRGRHRCELPALPAVTPRIARGRPGEEVQPEGEPFDASHVLQQVTRMRDADGRETLTGVLRCDVEPGQRSAALHVAFCPPFASTPRLEWHQIDGPACRIKVGQLFAYGARLDVRLSQPAGEPASLGVFFSAEQPGE